MKELNRILHDLDQGNVNVKTAKRQIFQLFELKNRPCTRRNVLRDEDGDLYYTGCMDCFDWLVDNDR